MPAEDIGDDRPVWERVVAGLRARIAAGHPGDRLPSISELSDEYGVGATTVKVAINALRLSGEIRTRRGQGTFIAGGLPGSDPEGLGRSPDGRPPQGQE